uniref:Feruloyl esterase n=1 Tax=Eutreptiella gymnastica TaxID=73025 RepID=A0A7S1NEY1_9EUGL
MTPAPKKTLLLGLLMLLQCTAPVLAKDGKTGYTGDVKTTVKDVGCTRSEDSTMDNLYPKTCIAGPPDGGLRCWWTHVPAAVKSDASLKVPLVIDMHGGGLCAHHEALASGFKQVSDSLGGNTFIVAWPQGYDYQWGTCGSDCDKAKTANAGKNAGKAIASQDDLTFLTNLVAYMVKNQAAANPAKGRVDPERVYSTGFSMGCMMSHRLAMERSNIVAAFGCHGGQLIGHYNLTEQKKQYGIQPTAAYMTGGTEDHWFNSFDSMDAWATFAGGCASEMTNTTVELPRVFVEKTGSYKPTNATLRVRSSCGSSTPAVEVARLEIAGAGHVMDNRMANLTWQFLKKYKRAGALAAPPASPNATAAAASPSNKSAAAATNQTAARGLLLLAVVVLAAAVVY